VADEPQFREQWARFLRRGAAPRDAANLLRMYREADVRHVLPAIDASALILHRSGDRLTPVAGGRRLAELIPGARFEEIAKARHLPNVEHPDAFNRLMLGWLGNHR
jgi:pimeloyl-ACP methyl ester carboxylesterase